MANYTLNEDKMFADVADGVAIIINAETGVYYGMNKFGTMVYQNLINGIACEDILEVIKVWDEKLVDNFNEFIKFLVENEIIISSALVDNIPEIALDEAVAKEDEYTLKAQEYLDAQELLLADPIHEVKEEEGWSPEKSSLNEDKEDVARREAKMGLNK